MPKGRESVLAAGLDCAAVGSHGTCLMRRTESAEAALQPVFCIRHAARDDAPGVVQNETRLVGMVLSPTLFRCRSSVMARSARSRVFSGCSLRRRPLPLPKASVRRLSQWNALAAAPLLAVVVFLGCAKEVVLAPGLELSLRPPAVALTPGDTQQFTIVGLRNADSAAAITYSANGGMITQAGLFIAGSAPGTYFVVASQQNRTWAETSKVTVALPVDLTVREESLGYVIPDNFIGLSYEKPEISRPGMFALTHARLVELLRNLGPGVLRFGGGSLESTGWSDSARTGSTPEDVLTPTDYASLVAFARAVDWKLILGLNLGVFNPNLAADEASHVAQLAQGSLLSLEVGNEPDEYPAQGLRPAGYGYGDFKSEFESYAAAIVGFAPNLNFSGPATAGSRTIQTWVLQFLQDENARVAFASYHLYPLGPTSLEPATSPRYATIANLLSPVMMQSVASELGELRRAASTEARPFRITETNSCYAGGQPGVSDVYASALWGVDYLFTLAENGSEGANFHVGTSAPYAPIEEGTDIPHPLYYGMLFFTQAARGRLVQTSLSSDQGANVSAYASLPAAGQLHVVLVNKESSRALRIKIRTTKAYSQGLSLRLVGPSLLATTGVTIGGVAIGASGAWSASFSPDISIRGSTASVDVPAASAVLVRLTGATP